MSFSSLLIMILFIKVQGTVSLDTLLHVDSLLVESAVNVDYLAMDGALSPSTHWVISNSIANIKKNFLVSGLNPIGKTSCTYSLLHLLIEGRICDLLFL